MLSIRGQRVSRVVCSMDPEPEIPPQCGAVGLLTSHLANTREFARVSPEHAYRHRLCCNTAHESVGTYKTHEGVDVGYPAVRAEVWGVLRIHSGAPDHDRSRHSRFT